MITHHTQLLNALIEKYNLKSYLEIGVQTREQNFDKIKCYLKLGVDPEIKNTPLVLSMTSDIFFDKFNDEKFDLIFIDGLHHADQVKRDFENSLRCLSDNGFIVIHDVLPENEEGTIVPRQTKIWWGDVYKWAMNIGAYPEVEYETFNIDNGCMLVWKTSRVIPVRGYDDKATWNSYLERGKELMNVQDEVKI